jgi:Fe(3+) dicitrate transport protein
MHPIRPLSGPAIALSALLALALASHAQQPTPLLPDTTITAEAESSPLIQGPFMPDVVQGKIFAGKKTTVIDFDSLPQIQTDNYRQAFTKTPGLLVSELSNNSLLSLGSRGIGDPHESQNILVLKDGVPFVLDMFGYPTVYYAPPLEGVDRLEYVRGGSSLLYGPQPGGSLNYISHRPRTDRPFGFSTQNLFGSNQFFANYTSVDGTIGRLSYLVNYNHRQGNSFRTSNSDYELNGGNIKLGLDLNTDTRWLLDVDLYKSNAGEPGGLTHASGPGVLNYNHNRTQAQLQHDRVMVERYFGTLSMEHDFNSDTTIIAKLFGGYANRTSHRQRGTGFGTLPGSNLNTINEHRYYTIGSDIRVSHDWAAWGGEHHLTAGMTSGYTYSPITNQLGRSPTDRSGLLYNDITRRTAYLAFFAENQFKWGRFSLIPGFRFENIYTTIDDDLRRDSAPPNGLLPQRYREDAEHVPLGALGLSYDVTTASTVYFNLSQGYKPATYGDVLPVDNNVANTDLNPGSTLTYELGYRGKPSSFLNWDVSGFYIDYDGRFGQTTAGGITTVQNTGRSRNMGIDIASEIDLIGIFGGEAATKRHGNLALHVAYEWLNAEFVDGPLGGFTPQYAPEHLLRVGLTYRWRDRFKISFLHTYVSEHFANDNNTLDFQIPAYSVSDITAEAKIFQNVTLLAGLNNVFNEDYYSRVRANGIDPAWGRNYYVGVRFTY